MKTEDLLTLDANPSDAPCCVKLENAQGDSILFQTDYEWPAVARLFGFALASVQKCKRCRLVSAVLSDEWLCPKCDKGTSNPCEHDGTDGTVPCACGVTAGDFIAAARGYLDAHDGETCENPGYTLEKETT